jgi:hypothetical protein
MNLKTKKSLEKTLPIIKYLNFIARPKKKLKGHAICPFINRYRDKIQIVKTDDYNQKVAQSVELMGPLGLEAVVLHGKQMAYDRLERYVNTWNRLYREKDIEILFQHPDTEDPPIDYYYEYVHSPIVIIQKRSTLLQARNELAKNTDYYTIYDSKN